MLDFFIAVTSEVDLQLVASLLVQNGRNSRTVVESNSLLGDVLLSYLNGLGSLVDHVDRLRNTLVAH